MSFPVLEARSPAGPLASENPRSVKSDAEILPAARAPGQCTACDGTGLWRGIDGFVFVCQHCTFEMT